MLRYDIGGRYVPHWDYFEDVIPTYNDIVAGVGNRVGTVIVYLNDVEEGGQTTFTKLNLSVDPKKGSMIYFRYDYKNKNDNANTMHSGEPVIKGHKYIVTTWIREFPFL
jgi:prolyl 4-hydroxylase